MNLKACRNCYNYPVEIISVYETYEGFERLKINYFCPSCDEIDKKREKAIQDWNLFNGERD